MQIIENAGVQPSGSSSKPVHIKKPAFRRDAKSSFVAANNPSSAKITSSKSTSTKCLMCSGAHQLADCPRFKALSLDERYNCVCTNRICMVCFAEGHMSYKCSSSCAICKRRHHALLHRGANPKPVKPPAALLGRQQAPTVLLGTALVHVLDVVGSYRTVRALIDSASQISAITSTCCDRLGLNPSRWTVPITGLSSQKVPDVQGIVQLTIQLRDSSTPSINVQPWVLTTITSDIMFWLALYCIRRRLPQIIARCIDRLMCSHKWLR